MSAQKINWKQLAAKKAQAAQEGAGQRPSQQELNKFEEKAKEADESLATVEGKVSGLDTRANKTKTALSSLEDGTSQLSLTLKSVSEDVDTAGAGAQQLSGRLTALVSDVSGLEARAGEAERKIKAAEDEVESVGARPEALVADLEDAERRVKGAVDAVGNKPAELQTTLARTEGAIAELGTHAGEVTGKLETAKTTVNGLTTKAAEVQQALAAAESAAQSERQTTDDYVRETLNPKLEELNRLIADLRSKLQAAEQRAEGAEARLAAIKTEQGAELAELRAGLADLEERMDQSDEQNDDFVGSVQEMLEPLVATNQTAEIFADLKEALALRQEPPDNASEEQMQETEEASKRMRRAAYIKLARKYGVEELLAAAYGVHGMQQIQLLWQRVQNELLDIEIQPIFKKDVAYDAVKAACDQHLPLDLEKRQESIWTDVKKNGRDLVVEELQRWGGNELAGQMLEYIEKMEESVELVSAMLESGHDEQGMVEAFNHAINTLGGEYIVPELQRWENLGDEGAGWLLDTQVRNEPGDGQ